ncbi:MAG: sugar phosphate isomerase/epimerase [Bryobacterales bacterium]|nr:sugar phosphate isomerase/epimerase [Bryobacterales bacterium]MDE0296820.1 sugar phosphate isomerase/epimerase [Bryobacterales bacterium]MDE0433570.1 sugar phosphate isomerase/epimerase [Bryobacterales bacterium]
MSEYTFKLAVCNELYEKTDFAASCRSLKKAGWQGIEIAPFTLRNDATTLPAERRKEVRNIIQSEGLEFVGLHWLTVGPTGLHVTTPDEAMRKHSWDFVRRLVDLCADLRQGDSGGVMVFGSPMQRRTTGGLSPQQSTTHFIDGVRSITGHLEDLGVTLLVEALPSEQCDVIGSLDEAIAVVRAVNSPAVRSMFDSHNAIEETTPHSELVEKYWDFIRHIHINELDGSYVRPGGGYDFKPVLQIAKDRKFDGWVSMEVFDFAPGAEKMVNESIAYLRDEIARLN